MRTVFYTNSVSPHQLPLAREVAARIGEGNFLYVSESPEWMGQTVRADVRILPAEDAEAREWLENADVLYAGGLRPIDLFERRAARGLRTLYYSERWFKPIRLSGLSDCPISGRVRMLVPGYRRMAKRFVRLANDHDRVSFLPTGPWAARDFLKMGVKAEKMIPWGYFVEAGPRGPARPRDPEGLRVLWCGRMVDWKRVEDLVEATGRFRGEGKGRVRLTLAGEGPEEMRLKALVRRLKLGESVTFLPRQPLEKVRELMRAHDLYVLTSDGTEGWGAVVNEALEEGLSAVGTFEAGASAALLPEERLFHAGDRRMLARLIEREMRGELPRCSIGEWTAAKAAERLLEVSK